MDSDVTQTLSKFPDGLKVRHQAYIRKKVISTLYGVIRNGFIETNELNGNVELFETPLDFGKAHKKTKIQNEKYQVIKSKSWNIVDYWDVQDHTWKKLNTFPRKAQVNSRDSIQRPCDQDDDKDEDEDAMSFVTCKSFDCSEIVDDPKTEYPQEECIDDLPYQYIWKQIDTIEVWQWSLWAKQEFIDAVIQNCNEQDEINLCEIEDELDYEAFDRENPWITRYNLPHEEELWIATIIPIPIYGEVWMDAFGNSWEIVGKNGCLAEVGRWIGKWSWDNYMMNMGAKEPSPLLDDMEFWDVLQDFET
jgi:hypothetical protein